MMGATEILELIAGGMLRLLLPVGVTVLLAVVLKRMDDRWRVESLRETMAAAGVSGPIQELNCWEAHDCPPERRNQCRASQNPDQPCWNTFSVNGQMQSSCKRCAYRKLKLAAVATR